MNKLRYFALAGTLSSSLFCAAAGNAAPLVKTQPPCNGACVQFEGPGEATYLVRSISFNAPRSGISLVHFHGNLACRGAAGDSFNGGSQIVLNKNSQVNEVGPGGLPLVHRLPKPANPEFTPPWDSNLASTRVVKVTSAGKQDYHFKIKHIILGQNMECEVYVGTFSVLFIPD